MTRKQLTDPFGSDDEDDHAPAPSSPKKQASPQPVAGSESTGQILRDSEVPSLISVTSPPPVEESSVKATSPQRDTKSEDLKKRARELLEQTKREAAASSPVKTLPRQASQVCRYRRLWRIN